MLMKTKAVYVVVTDGADAYFEQAWMSAWSLKHYNPMMEVDFVVDEATHTLITTTYRRHIIQVVDKIVSIDVPSSLNKKERSRWLKTTLRQHIEGDYLFLDTDTVVCGGLASIEQLTCNFAAVLDGNDKRSITCDKKRYDWLKWQAKIAQLHDDFSEEAYYNSGVLYVKDNIATHTLYEEWHRQWQQSNSLGVTFDQPVLYCAAKATQTPISALPPQFNCQIVDKGLPYLSDALVIHYYNSSPFYLIARHSVVQFLREKQVLPDEVKSLLLHARSAFADNTQIIAAEDAEFLQSNLHRLVKAFPKVFHLLDRLSYYLLRLKAKLWD